MSQLGPLSGGRAFLAEVGIVVLGVLLALGAGELVRIARQSSDASSANSNIRAEIAEALGRMQSRMEIQDCVDRRLAEISSALIAADRGEAVPTFSWVGRPQSWSLTTARWEAALNSGAAGLLSANEQERYGFFYSGFREFEDHERTEQAAWAQLRSLTEIRHLEAPQRAFLTQALQAARFASYRIGRIFAQRQARARANGIAPTPPNFVGGRSVCIPRNTPRAEAEAMDIRTDREPD